MNKLYESGLSAKAVLEYTGTLNKEAKEALRESFEEFGNGAKNTGRILPVPLGMKLTPLDIKLTDSQFFELKKYTSLQIAAAFGVKPNQINDYEKSSYSNSEMQQLSFYVDTMLFIIKQYEEELNFKLLTPDEQDDGMYFKFNEKVLFRTDSKTQIRYMDDMVVFGKNKKELHRMQQEIERFLREKFNLQMKGNWQVFRFDYTEKKTGKRKGRPLDFMGFQFYHDKTILRESIMLSCTRKVNRVAKKEKITWYDATAILSYMGYLSNTDTYDMYLQKQQVII